MTNADYNTLQCRIKAPQGQVDATTCKTVLQRTTFYFATFCKKCLQKTIYGGLPLVLRFEKPEEKIAFLKSLFEETYISDIVGRHNIRNRAELEELV